VTIVAYPYGVDLLLASAFVIIILCTVVQPECIDLTPYVIKLLVALVTCFRFVSL
jgi:hypothetical protein